jgi:DNA-directed RNA polymerase subunit RPC12/RpoP
VRFSCDECGRSYVASDDVAGRAFRMRCKQCGSEMVVRPPSTASTPFSPHAHAATPAPVRDDRGRAGGEPPPRRTFDPFEGEDLPEGDIAVADETLEILERTPAPKPIARRPHPAPPAAAAPRAPAVSAPSTPAPPRRRTGRLLPAEDEAMLGPPGAEDRRSLPRWVIALAVGALAAAGAIAYFR